LSPIAEYTNEMSLLQELQEQRADECRLVAERALQSLEDAESFLHDRRLLTRTADCSLPSLFKAMHEEPYAAGTGGFGSWPRTKYPWSFQLSSKEHVYTLKIHRGKTLYLSEEAARLVDPICRAEIERLQEAEERCDRLLRHLASAGPSLVEDIQVELSLSSPELKDVRSLLERCGAVATRAVIVPARSGGHRHQGELVRWDQVFTDTVTAAPDLGPLVVAGVRAAVVVPEREPRRWFSWTWRWEDDLVERLLDRGELVRPEPGWLAAT
jgi:hypothetical protein